MRLNEEVHRQVSAIASARDCSMRQVLEWAAREHYKSLDREEKELVDRILSVREKQREKTESETSPS